MSGLESKMESKTYLFEINFGIKLGVTNEVDNPSLSFFTGHSKSVGEFSVKRRRISTLRRHD